MRALYYALLTLFIKNEIMSPEPCQIHQRQQHAEVQVLVDIFNILTGGKSEKTVEQTNVVPSQTVGTLNHFSTITVVLMQYYDHTAFVRFREGGVSGKDFLTIHVDQTPTGKILAFWLAERNASGVNWLLWMKIYHKIFGSRRVHEIVKQFELMQDNPILSDADITTP